LKDDDHAPAVNNSLRTPPRFKMRGRKGSETPRSKREDSTLDEQSLNGCLGGF
jgi:hypothetical protein